MKRSATSVTLLLAVATAGLASSTLLAPRAFAANGPLGGYEVSTAADAVAIIPILPGFVPGADSPGEISLADTAASLATGGISYGRAALNYPGSFGAHLGPLMLEEGAPPVVANAMPPWPTLAEANAHSGTVTNHDVPNVTVQAYGSPTQAWGRSSLPGASLAPIISIGDIQASSKAIANGSNVTTVSMAVLHDVSIDAGLVMISTIQSTSGADSNSTSGTVQVAGVRVGGIAVKVDADGIHTTGLPTVPGSDPNGAINQLLTSAGIGLFLAEPIASRGAATTSRQVAGLLVSVATPESPVASAGHVVIELGATAAAVTVSTGAGPFSGPRGAPGLTVTPGVSGAPALATAIGALGATLPSSGLSTAQPSSVVLAPNETANLTSSASAATPSPGGLGGIPGVVLIAALLVLVMGAYGLRAFVNRLLAWQKGTG